MAVTNLRNFVLIPGLVKSNISPFLSLVRSIPAGVVWVFVTEHECLSNLEPLQDLPDVYVYAIDKASQSGCIQQEEARTVRLYQWHKYNVSLKYLKHIEKSKGYIANRVFKLRTDYCFASYQSLAAALVDHTELADDLLFCDSDRVFYGSRLTMLSLRHFLDVAVTLFLNRPDYYYPLSPKNMALTDFSCTRLDALNYDRRVMNCPDIHTYHKHLPLYHNALLVGSLNPPEDPPAASDIYSFHQGNRELPAERSFAWYLNVHGIIARRHPAMQGCIYR